MFIIESNELWNQVFEHYRRMRHEIEGCEPWLGANFYLDMDRWLRDDFKCTNYFLKDNNKTHTGVHVLDFESKEDYIRLILSI